MAHVGRPLRASMEAHGLTTLNDEVEVPLVRVLARMEHLGVGVDLAGAARACTTRSPPRPSGNVRRIIEAAGEDFNVNSTPQMRTILFDKLGLTPQKKTKTGYSTDQATLEKLQGRAPDHRAPAALPRGREAAFHLRRGAAWPRSPPTGASTPRSTRPWRAPVGCPRTRPNLHNIPVRSEEGRRFREAFVPRPGSSSSSRTTTRSSCG